MINIRIKKEYREKAPEILEKILKKYGKYFEGIRLDTLPPLPEELPDHLRKTYHALLELGEADATAISERTQRKRAIESAYLNQLCRMRYATKRRKDRKVIFTPI